MYKMYKSRAVQINTEQLPT